MKQRSTYISLNNVALITRFRGAYRVSSQSDSDGRAAKIADLFAHTPSPSGYEQCRRSLNGLATVMLLPLVAIGFFMAVLIGSPVFSKESKSAGLQPQDQSAQLGHPSEQERPDQLDQPDQLGQGGPSQEQSDFDPQQLPLPQFWDGEGPFSNSFSTAMSGKATGETINVHQGTIEEYATFLQSEASFSSNDLNDQSNTLSNPSATIDPWHLYDPMMGSLLNNGGILQHLSSSGAVEYQVQGSGQLPMTMISGRQAIFFACWLELGEPYHADLLATFDGALQERSTLPLGGRFHFQALSEDGIELNLDQPHLDNCSTQTQLLISRSDDQLPMMGLPAPVGGAGAGTTTAETTAGIGTEIGETLAAIGAGVGGLAAFREGDTGTFRAAGFEEEEGRGLPGGTSEGIAPRNETSTTRPGEPWDNGGSLTGGLNDTTTGAGYHGVQGSENTTSTRYEPSGQIGQPGDANANMFFGGPEADQEQKKDGSSAARDGDTTSRWDFFSGADDNLPSDDGIDGSPKTSSPAASSDGSPSREQKKGSPPVTPTKGAQRTIADQIADRQELLRGYYNKQADYLKASEEIEARLAQLQKRQGNGKLSDEERQLLGQKASHQAYIDGYQEEIDRILEEIIHLKAKEKRPQDLEHENALLRERLTEVEKERATLLGTPVIAHAVEVIRDPLTATHLPIVVGDPASTILSGGSRSSSGDRDPSQIFPSAPPAETDFSGDSWSNEHKVSHAAHRPTGDQHSRRHGYPITAKRISDHIGKEIPSAAGEGAVGALLEHGPGSSKDLQDRLNSSLGISQALKTRVEQDFDNKANSFPGIIGGVFRGATGGEEWSPREKELHDRITEYTKHHTILEEALKELKDPLLPLPGSGRAIPAAYHPDDHSEVTDPGAPADRITPTAPPAPAALPPIKGDADPWQWSVSRSQFGGNAAQADQISWSNNHEFQWLDRLLEGVPEREHQSKEEKEYVEEKVLPPFKSAISPLAQQANDDILAQSRNLVAAEGGALSPEEWDRQSKEVAFCISFYYELALYLREYPPTAEHLATYDYWIRKAEFAYLQDVEKQPKQYGPTPSRVAGVIGAKMRELVERKAEVGDPKNDYPFLTGLSRVHTAESQKATIAAELARSREIFEFLGLHSRYASYFLRYYGRDSYFYNPWRYRYEFDWMKQALTRIPERDRQTPEQKSYVDKVVIPQIEKRMEEIAKRDQIFDQERRFLNETEGSGNTNAKIVVEHNASGLGYYKEYTMFLQKYADPKEAFYDHRWERFLPWSSYQKSFVIRGDPYQQLFEQGAHYLLEKTIFQASTSIKHREFYDHPSDLLSEEEWELFLAKKKAHLKEVSKDTLYKLMNANMFDILYSRDIWLVRKLKLERALPHLKLGADPDFRNVADHQAKIKEAKATIQDPQEEIKAHEAGLETQQKLLQEKMAKMNVVRPFISSEITRLERSLDEAGWRSKPSTNERKASHLAQLRSLASGIEEVTPQYIAHLTEKHRQLELEKQQLKKARKELEEAGANNLNLLNQADEEARKVLLYQNSIDKELLKLEEKSKTIAPAVSSRGWGAYYNSQAYQDQQKYWQKQEEQNRRKQQENLQMSRQLANKSAQDFINMQRYINQTYYKLN